MTTTMQIYLTIGVIVFLIFIITIVATSILGGSYYYEKIENVFRFIAETSFFTFIGWIAWIVIAGIWHLY